MSTPQIVQVSDANAFSLSYGGDAAQRNALAKDWLKFRQPDPATNQLLEVWSRFTYALPGQVTAEYRMPAGAPAGSYRIEAFIPSQRATVGDAQYRIAHRFRTKQGVEAYDETLVTVNQGYHYDRWVPLGWFRLDPSAHALEGRVQLSNYSAGPKRLAAFGPLRWIHLPDSPETQSFDAPVGFAEERAEPLLENEYQFRNKPRWLKGWYDYTPFFEWYSLGCHPGVDLNSTVSPAADKGAPVYSSADGIVVYAGLAGSWGQIVVILHPEALVTLPSGAVERRHVYARYGHLANLLVQNGKHVQKGEQIGKIGLMAGATAGWHLHFDIAFTEVLRLRPAYWTPYKTRPRFDVRREVAANYVDPYVFLRDNHKIRIGGRK